MDPIAIAWIISIPILALALCVFIGTCKWCDSEFIFFGIMLMVICSIVFGLVSNCMSFHVKHQVLDPLDIVKADNAKMVVCFYGDLDDPQYKVSEKAAFYNRAESLAVKRSQGINMWGKKTTPEYELILRSSDI